jgi:hypothetical protein
VSPEKFRETPLVAYWRKVGIVLKSAISSDEKKVQPFEKEDLGRIFENTIGTVTFSIWPWYYQVWLPTRPVNAAQFFKSL